VSALEGQRAVLEAQAARLRAEHDLAVAVQQEQQALHESELAAAELRRINEVTALSVAVSAAEQAAADALERLHALQHQLHALQERDAAERSCHLEQLTAVRLERDALRQVLATIGGVPDAVVADDARLLLDAPIQRSSAAVALPAPPPVTVPPPRAVDEAAAKAAWLGRLDTPAWAPKAPAAAPPPPAPQAQPDTAVTAAHIPQTPQLTSLTTAAALEESAQDAAKRSWLAKLDAPTSKGRTTAATTADLSQVARAARQAWFAQIGVEPPGW
jgi:hypothetical protein